MPSKKLTDCVPALMNAYVSVREMYEAAHPGHRMVTDCTHRSSEDQAILFQVGRVERNGHWVEDDDAETRIVTQIDGVTKVSEHNLLPARAVDFHLEVGGKPSWDIIAYLPIGALAQKHGLVWGGTWGAPATPDEIRRRVKAKQFIDGCHLQLPLDNAAAPA